MMFHRNLIPQSALWILSALFTLSSTCLCAQESESRSAQYIPDDAIVAAMLSPSQLMASPEWQMMPIEVIQAAGLEYVGIDPRDIEGLKLIIGMPMPCLLYTSDAADDRT